MATPSYTLEGILGALDAPFFLPGEKMAVSGTISQTTFPTRKVVDHAFRRCRIPVQLVTSEHLQVALDLLYLLMSELVNKGIPLWCIDTLLLPMYESDTQVPCPDGTVDILNLNLRNVQRLSGTASATEGTAANAFDGDVETACTQSTPGGNITLEFESETMVSNFGILPNASGTWNIRVQTSPDGITYTTIYSNTALAAVAGEWFWFDVTTPETTSAGVALNDVMFVRLIATAPTVLDVSEFVVANMPNEIPMARLNRDDYINLPGKSYQGRPVQFWLDLQRVNPLIHLWPAVQAPFTFYQLVMTRKRYLMDVGTLTDMLDIPQRWFEAIIAQLAVRLARETQEVDVNLIPMLQGDADRAMSVAWNAEGDNSPVFMRINLSPYTS